MKDLIMIAAIGKNYELGKDNQLLWYLPSDLKFFKEKTLNKYIVMGHNTFKSFPKPLPKRTHVVITTKDIDLGNNIIVLHSVEETLKYLKDINDDVYVIGGASIYRQFLNYADKMYLTEIEENFKDADVYFPKFNHDEWESEVLKVDEENNLKYKHLLYKKKKR